MTTECTTTCDYCGTKLEGQLQLISHGFSPQVHKQEEKVEDSDFCDATCMSLWVASKYPRTMTKTRIERAQVKRGQNMALPNPTFILTRSE